MPRASLPGPEKSTVSFRESRSIGSRATNLDIVSISPQCDRGSKTCNTSTTHTDLKSWHGKYRDKDQASDQLETC